MKKEKGYYQCPVCECSNTEVQHDYEHMSECNRCGSEWITETNEITLHAYEDVS